ncbi:hypothetical protein KCU71_g74, partial [Aureobasidium melanogenum]
MAWKKANVPGSSSNALARIGHFIAIELVDVQLSNFETSAVGIFSCGVAPGMLVPVCLVRLSINDGEMR